MKVAGAKYALALKGNRGTIHEAVEAYFAEQEKRGFSGCSIPITEEKGHGRWEKRVHYAPPLTAEMKLPLVSDKSKHDLTDVVSVVMTERSRKEGKSR